MTDVNNISPEQIAAASLASTALDIYGKTLRSVIETAVILRRASDDAVMHELGTVDRDVFGGERVIPAIARAQIVTAAIVAAINAALDAADADPDTERPPNATERDRTQPN
jgi:hypothetical protein